MFLHCVVGVIMDSSFLTAAEPSKCWSIIALRQLPKNKMPCSQLLTFFVGGEIVDLVLQSGAVAKFVLILLLRSA